jgi:hypothetical protein
MRNSLRSNPTSYSSLSTPVRPASFIKGVTKVSSLAAALTAVGLGALTLNSCSQYQDLPGYSEDTSLGRTKNALATVVAGLVAEKISPEATIHFTIERFWFPDAELEGTVHNGEIHTHLPLALTSATFDAHSNGGQIQGTIDKSEFDWELRPSGPNKWEVGRALLKFDHTLTLQVHGGIISGELQRTAGFNWTIEGTYSPEGKVEISIDGPMTLGIVLKGSVVGPPHRGN